MTRRYGRSADGSRCVDAAPLSTPKNTTVLSSIRYNGEICSSVYSGGTTGDVFANYLKNILIPTLHKGDIVVMDNMRSHHVDDVAKAFENTGISFCYLPPYSPDFNPIEKMWSKLKSILRKWKIRLFSSLPNAIIDALKLVSVSDCQHWFNKATLCSSL